LIKALSDKAIFNLALREYVVSYSKYFIYYALLFAGLEFLRFLLAKWIGPLVDVGPLPDPLVWPSAERLFLNGDFGQLFDFLKLSRDYAFLHPEKRALVQFLTFMTFLQGILPLIVFYPLTKHIASGINQIGNRIYGQVIVCATISGILTAIVWSILHFLFRLMNREFALAFIDLISLLWRFVIYVVPLLIYFSLLVFIIVHLSKMETKKISE